MKWLYYSFLTLLSLGMLSLIAGVVAVIGIISWFGQDLPDYSTLKDYKPPIVSRAYAGDGRLLAEFAQEKRIFVPVEVVPDLVLNAFISAEDQNFWTHPGVDYFAIMRAVVTNIRNAGSGRRLVGASTITQQVAKNFLLTNEVSYERKIKEAILAFRMEKAMSKERLLELYLNEIYLGMGTYGVAAASLNYFNKSLEELDIHEAAYLAALPKAPNNYHPVKDHDEALARRNWVIGRMAEDGHISTSQAELAQLKPLEMLGDGTLSAINAPYFAEEIRRELIERYGDEGLYQGGLVVRASVDPALQKVAREALREGLVEYDRRQGGWRGPVTSLDQIAGWRERLAEIEPPPGMPDDWQLALIRNVSDSSALFGLSNGDEGQLDLQYLSWARPVNDQGKRGPEVTSVKQVLSRGDVVMVTKVELEDGETVWALRQIPKVNGALVALDPHTGRVLAMQGGWSYEESEFNRVTQARRQPGSAFKPFIYLAALDKGFTPATLVLDAPFVIDQGPGLPKWRPSNYSREFYGPTPIRVGLEKSRNLMTVRLADYIGMELVADYVESFGIIDKMPTNLASALGSQETTLMRMATAYAQFVNGGKKLVPTVIDRIQDRRGQTIFRHDDRPCENCGPLVQWEGQAVPAVPDNRPQIADPRKAYQIVSMLEGVVQRGTGVRAKQLGRPLAGKTGTTNEARDTWFIGFSPDLVVGVYIGYDEPTPLGKKETGSSVALPVFIDFMDDALADQSPTPFRVPAGVRHVQINAETGARAQPGDERVIWESFLAGTEPTDQVYILDGQGISLMPVVRLGNSRAALAQEYGDEGEFISPYDADGDITTGRDSVFTGTGGIY